MKDLLVISGIVGGLLPFAIALINQSHWAPGLKSVIAFLCCLIAAFITVWAKGDITATDYIASALTVFTVARASYAGLWRPTGTAPALEASTTVTKAPGTRA